MANDLKIHLALNEINHNNQVLDQSGNGFHGSVVGGVSTITDENFGTCLAFDGVDGYIELPDLQFNGQNGITVEAWVKFDAFQHYSRIFDMNFEVINGGVSSGHWRKQLVLCNVEKTGRILFRNAGADALSDPIETDTWYHIAATHSPDGSTKMYFNGVLVNSGQGDFFPSGFENIWTCWLIAKSIYDWDEYFKGTMHNFRIYERPLSLEEINQDMQTDATSHLTGPANEPTPHSGKSDLILHLSLAEIRGNKALDQSGNEYHGIIQGGVTTVIDEFIGSCASFDGETAYIDVPELQFNGQRGITVEAWVKNEDSESAARFFDIQQHFDDPNEDYSLENEELWALRTLGKLGQMMFVHALSWRDPSEIDTGVWHQISTIDPLETHKSWYHMAATHAPDGALNLYINGTLVAEGHATYFVTEFENSSEDWYIGRSADDLNEFFKGTMSNIRIYERPLSIEEIQRDMHIDQSANKGFRNSKELEFDLFTAKDGDERPVMYIEALGFGNPLVLKTTNNSGRDYVLAKSEETAGFDSYHFQLRFRLKTLSDNFIQNDLDNALEAFRQTAMPDGTSNENWECFHGADTEHLNYVISFLWKGAEDLPLNKTTVLRLQIPGVNIAQGGGHRGTRVEIKYNHIREPEASAELKGFSTRHLEIVSLSGLKTCPMMAGVLGSNTILNDAKSAQTITLFLRNTSHEKDIDFWHEADGVSEKTRFVISFDQQWFEEHRTSSGKSSVDTEENSTHGGGISIATVPEGLLGLAHTGSHEYIFEAKTLTKLTPGQEIQFTVSGIMTNQPDGVINMYIQYWNVPGYQDGRFSAPIQIQPIVMRGDDLGIGIAEPKSRLDVNGDIRLNDHALYFRGGTDKNHGIQWANGPDKGTGNVQVAGENFTNIQESEKFDGPFVYGNQGGALGTITRKIALWWKGINVTVNGTLTALKEIKGKEAIRTDKKFYDDSGEVMPKGAIIMWSGSTENIPAGFVLCDGKNGTPELINRFVLGAGGRYSHGTHAGAESVTLTTDQMPRHTHVVNDPGHSHPVRGIQRHHRSFKGNDDPDIVLKYNGGIDVTYTADTRTTGISVKSEGSNQSHDNMPPYWALCYIMKL